MNGANLKSFNLSSASFIDFAEKIKLMACNKIAFRRPNSYINQSSDIGNIEKIIKSIWFMTRCPFFN